MTGMLAGLIQKATTALTLVDTPTNVSGYGSSGASANVTTGLVSATAAGGSPPYTYLWTQTGTSPYTWTIGAATAAATSFTCNSLGAGNTAENTFLCTVTDAGGAKASASVSAFTNNGQPYDNRVVADRTGVRSTL